MARGLSALAAAALLAAACSREHASPPETVAPAPAPAPVAGAPSDLSDTAVETTIPLGGPELVTAVRLGPAGAAEPRSFAAGSPITATLETRPLPAGSVVRMVLRKGDVTVETQKGAEENARSVVVTTDQTHTMEPGSWTLEIWLGGDKVDERTIEITRGPGGPGV